MLSAGEVAILNGRASGWVLFVIFRSSNACSTNEPGVSTERCEADFCIFREYGERVFTKRILDLF